MSRIDIITPADVDIMARTIYGEARGTDFLDRMGVAHTILNRVRAEHRRETTIAGVCLEPFQFSCWNKDDVNRFKIANVGVDSEIFRACMVAALEAINAKQDADPTDGATHYHALSITPSWARGHTPCLHTTGHLFYNTVR